MSETIEQILLLIRVMTEELKDVHSISARRNRAVHIVAELCEVAPETIHDKYTRRLGIHVKEFDELLRKFFENGDKAIFDVLKKHGDAQDRVAISNFVRGLFPTIKLAPSILSADFARLAEQVREATEAGADYIHVDVMDGGFVPNITIGAPVVAAIRPYTNLPLDVHLMVEAPEKHIQRFADAGANIITVHAEACPHLHRVVQSIKELKLNAGVALNPGTPLTIVDEVLSNIDLVLVMTVNPGFGGQVFIESMLDKIARLRRRLDEAGLVCELEVDGGITAKLAPKVVQAGARVLVAGSAVFNRKESVAQAIGRIRDALVLKR